MEWKCHSLEIPERVGIMASIIEEIKESLPANNKGNLPIHHSYDSICRFFDFDRNRTADGEVNCNRKVIDEFLYVISGYAASRTISYEEMATKLLNEKLLLTALELHAELCEAGKELPILKEFFSNPNNFESSSIKPEPYTPMRMYLVISQ